MGSRSGGTSKTWRFCASRSAASSTAESFLSSAGAAVDVPGVVADAEALLNDAELVGVAPEVEDWLKTSRASESWLGRLAVVDSGRDHCQRLRGARRQSESIVVDDEQARLLNVGDVATENWSCLAGALMGLMQIGAARRHFLRTPLHLSNMHTQLRDIKYNSLY